MKALFSLIMLLISISMLAQAYTFVCEEFPPYEYNENGVAKGLDIEVLTLICKEAKIDFKVEFYPWKRCLYLMDNGKKDGVFAILKTKERMEKYNYSNKPISVDKRVVITRNELSDIKTMKDLNGKTVGIIAGNLYGGGFDEIKINADLSTDGRMLCEKFKAGRVDIIAINEYMAKHYLKGFKYNVAFTISNEYFYIAFNKDFPIERFNKAHEAVNFKKSVIWNKYK